jgi:hypothetical protein
VGGGWLLQAGRLVNCRVGSLLPFLPTTLPATACTLPHTTLLLHTTFDVTLLGVYLLGHLCCLPTPPPTCPYRYTLLLQVPLGY